MSKQRYEVKLVGSEHDHQQLLASLRLLPAALRHLHKSRIVQSIYFDTHEGRSVDENLAGISDRQKYRLRWYGSGDVGVRAQLECKIRSNGYGSKRVLALADPVDVAGAWRHLFVTTVRRGLRAHQGASGVLDGREPAQWIRYRRDYYATADKRLRITIDRDLVAADQRTNVRLDDRRRTPLPRLLIVEIKAAVEFRADLENFVRDLPLRPGKCSKFVMASVPGEAPTIY
ncbi:MAG: VTC domain-containing protein [Planctomycetota bacterium]